MHFRPLSPEPAALIRQLCASCYVCRNLASPPEGQVDAGQTTPCSGPGIQLGSSVRRHCGVDACLCSLRPGVASPSRLRAPAHIPTRAQSTRCHAATWHPHFNVPRKESIVPCPTLSRSSAAAGPLLVCSGDVCALISTLNTFCPNQWPLNQLQMLR